MPVNYNIGDSFEIKRSFSYDDVKHFSEISGDINPIHLDANLAARSIFGKPIVHGLLVSSLFSAVIANHLPGPGSVYLHQSLNFKAPVFHDTVVIAKVEILSKKSDKPIYELRTTCTTESGEILIEGNAVVLNKSL